MILDQDGTGFIVDDGGSAPDPPTRRLSAHRRGARVNSSTGRDWSTVRVNSLRAIREPGAGGSV